MRFVGSRRNAPNRYLNHNFQSNIALNKKTRYRDRIWPRCDQFSRIIRTQPQKRFFQTGQDTLHVSSAAVIESLF